MPNVSISSWSSSRGPAQSSEKIAAPRPSPFRRAAAGAFALLVGASTGCGEEDDGTTYAGDVRPIFSQRCTICHYAFSPSHVDIQNPYSPGGLSVEDSRFPGGRKQSFPGLIEAPNGWKVGHPEFNVPERNVVPGEPENSFLINKISDPSLGLLPGNAEGDVPGEPMPLQIPELTPLQKDLMADWVAAQAPNGAFMDRNDMPRSYEQHIKPIIGDEVTCSLQSVGCGACIYCHYRGAENPPDLSDPFGPEGVVGVTSNYRSDLKRIQPGDPENSLLIIKINLEQPDSAYGAKMPYSFDPLTPSQVETVRQWILEGARP